MKMLFSPVGTADPMTKLGDGPLVHIVRHEHPDYVMLYLSPKMAKYQELDQRFTRGIKDVCCQEGIEEPEIECEVSEYDEVHRFDVYIERFEKHLGDLIDASEDDEVIVNVSSGTPGMQEALVAIASFGKYQVRLLQVTTPRRDTNKGADRENHDDFDYDALWGMNPDNDDAAESRIVYVETPNFSKRLVRERVISLVGKYEYAAAAELLKDGGDLLQPAAKFIRAAAERIKLNTKVAKDAFKGCAVDGMSLECRPTEVSATLAEYLAVLEVRLKQGQYADFVRGLTPAITETMLSVLDPYLPRDAYLADDSPYGKGYYLDPAKIKADDILKKVLHKVKFDNDSDRPFLTNRHLAGLIEEKVPNSDADRQTILKINGFEKRARNKVAHQIVKVTAADLNKMGKMKPAEVLKGLFELNDIEPGLYDRINTLILERL